MGERTVAGSVWRLLAALAGLLVALVWGYGAFPLGVAAGWLVLFGELVWPPAEVGGAFFWRFPLGVLIGGIVYRCGVALRRELRLAMADWQDRTE